MTAAELITAVTTALTGAGFTVGGPDPLPSATGKPVTVAYEWGRPQGLPSSVQIYTDTIKIVFEAPTVAAQTDGAADTVLIGWAEECNTALKASAALRGAALRRESFAPAQRGRTRRTVTAIYTVRRVN